MKIILHIAVLVLVGVWFLSLPTPTLAQDTPPFVTCNGPDCTICSLTTSINNIIQFTVTLAVILATIILAYGGFKLVFSKGDPGAIAQAKTYLINTVIGVILILAAWTLIDTLMRVLVQESRFGPWHEINPAQCRGQNATGTPVTEVPRVGANVSTIQYDAAATESTITITNEYGPGGTYGLEGGETAPVAADADSQFSFNDGISAQMQHASPSLRSMLNCMARRVPANVGRISSISDGMIVSGQRTFAQCAAGQCQHTANSRHYGGANYTGSSYAVDFGDEENVGTLCAAANACGRVRSCSVHNGNHVHLDLYYPNGT